jgi:hypothetical protein
MSLSNAFETDLLNLLFQNTNIANLGDATGVRGSTTAGSLYISLHTADPGEAGTQATSETAYTGYARIAVARSSAGFTVSGNTVSNAAAINFGNCTASPGSAVTYFGVGLASSGATELLMSGALSSSYTVAIGNAPSFAIGALTATAD